MEFEGLIRGVLFVILLLFVNFVVQLALSKEDIHPGTYAVLVVGVIVIICIFALLGIRPWPK
jgi:hypothetical protein